MAGANIVARMLIPTAGLALPFPASRLWLPAAALAIGHALAYDDAWKRLISRLPTAAVGFGQAAIIMLAILFAAGSDKAFVYFQF